MQPNQKKGIVIASVGSDGSLLLTEIKRYHTECAVTQAYTNDVILERLRKDSICVPSVAQAMDDMRRRGVEKVLIQPLLMICGEEYGKIVAIVKQGQTHFSDVRVGQPLLAKKENVEKVLSFYEKCLKNSAAEALVLMGHGNKGNIHTSYLELQELAREKGVPIYIGTLEGVLGIEQLIEVLHQEGCKKLLLMPLMLYAGTHVSRQMCGIEGMSWERRLKETGFEVQVVESGILASSEVRTIFQKEIAFHIKKLE